MFDREKANLESILDHISEIKKRFSKINSPDDFIISDDGKTLLDAIAIRLQAIGENVKKIQKLNSKLLPRYKEIPWDKIILFRNLISHHYELLNHEIIFSICKDDIQILENAIRKILSKN